MYAFILKKKNIYIYIYIYVCVCVCVFYSIFYEITTNTLIRNPNKMDNS